MSTPLQSTALPTELSKDANNALRIECFIPQWEESEVEPQGTLLSCTEKQSSKTYLCRRTPTHPFPAPATTWINLLPSRPVHISHREREEKHAKWYQNGHTRYYNITKCSSTSACMEGQGYDIKVNTLYDWASDYKRNNSTVAKLNISETNVITRHPLHA